MMINDMKHSHEVAIEFDIKYVLSHRIDKKVGECDRGTKVKVG